MTHCFALQIEKEVVLPLGDVLTIGDWWVCCPPTGCGGIYYVKVQ